MGVRSQGKRFMDFKYQKIPAACYRTTRFYLIFSLCILTSAKNFSQTLNKKELGLGHYSIVGAFCIAGNADRFSKSLIKNGHQASIGHSSENDIYYVYLGHHEIRENSVQEVLKIRQTTDFTDAWVKSITNDSLENFTDLKIDDLIIENSAPEFSNENVVTENLSESLDNGEIKQYAQITLKNTEIFLSLYDATNNRVVDGAVKVIDTDKSKLIESVNGNSYLYLSEPKNKSGTVS